MRHRITALAGAVLAGTVLSAVWELPAVADEPGFDVAVDAPGEFAAGGNTKTVTAVVTSQNRQCRKVRWALLVHTAVAPEQIRVTRIEQDREFPVSTNTEDITTRYLDDQADPGLLCRGRTVTGTWKISFDGPDADDVQFEAQAFDVRDRLLSAGGAGAEITGGAEPTEEPPPAEETEPPAGEDDVAEPEPPAAGDGRAGDAEDAGAALVSEDSSLLGPGLIIGGIFVFFGLLLLLRIRSRARDTRAQEDLPTGFYTMPGTRR